jgi:hypothetical protein
VTLTPTELAFVYDALTEAADYFDGRADADGNPDGTYTPNEEMSLLHTIESAMGCFPAGSVPPLLKHATTPESEALAGRLQPTPEYEYEDRYETQFLPPRPRDDIPF